MIKAVLFDMDGLLTDSERVAVEIDAGLYRQLGYNELTAETAMQTLGVTRAGTIDMYMALCPRFDPDVYYPLFDAAYAEALRNKRIGAKKGAVELLRYLQAKNIPYAICSSSDAGKVRLTLGSAGLLRYFSVFATGDLVKHGKPAPDIFLLGAEMLHVPPKDCLVLEDSINGIKAGTNAGMTVYMVPDLIPYRDELAPYCQAVCRDLTEVIQKIENDGNTL